MIALSVGRLRQPKPSNNPMIIDIGNVIECSASDANQANFKLDHHIGLNEGKYVGFTKHTYFTLGCQTPLC